MKTDKIADMIYDMLWTANEESENHKDFISSSSRDHSENNFVINVGKKYYKVTVEDYKFED